MINRLNTLSAGLKTLALSAAFAGGMVAAPLVASAQDAPSFADVDTNIDGVISEDELLAAMPDLTADAFALADVNGDTVLSTDEYETMAAMMPQ